MSPAPSVTDVFNRVRAYLKRRLGLMGVLWAALGLAVVLLLAWLFAGPQGWRTGSLVPLVLDALIVIGAVAGALWLRPRARRLLDEHDLSRTIERSAGMKRGAVLGSLELERTVPHGTSAALTRAATQEAARGLTDKPAHLAGSLGAQVERWIKRGAAALAIALPLVVLLAVTQPDRSTRAWSGLARPVRALMGQPLPALAVVPGSVAVLRGAAVEVSVAAQGRTAVTIHWRASGDVPRQDLAVVEDGSARYVFEAVDRELVYWAEAPDGARTPEYTITLVDPLLVTDVRFSLTFPAYTGRPAEEYSGRIGPLSIPAGTRMSIQGSASRALRSATLMRADGEPDEAALSLDVSGPSFGATWVPRRSGLYLWTFADPQGEPPTVIPEPLAIDLIPDLAPEVRVVFPGADTVMPLTHRQALAVEATDDYGLARLELISFRAGEEASAARTPIDLGGAAAIMARPVLDLSGWDLIPGDSVYYRVRVVDGSPGEQIGESSTYLLHVPTVGDLRRSAQDELQEAVSRLEELARRARQETEAGQQRAGDQSGNPQSMEFSEQQEMRQALERQEGLSGDVEALAAVLEALTEALKEAGLADGALSEDLQELQELLQQALSEEMESQMQELSESLDDADARAALDELKKLLEQQDEFRDQLEASVDRFKRAAVEQDFRATTEEAEELARKEQALAEQMAQESDPQARKAQQEELSQDADALMERMDELQRALEELGEQPASEQVDAARQKAEQGRQSMTQASESQDASEAAQSAKDAAQAMEEAAQEMAEAQKGMDEDLMERVQEALSQTARDALSLADEQADLREQMRGASRDELAEMRAEQAALAEGARNLEQNLKDAMRFSPLDAPAVAEMAEQATSEANQTADALDRRGSTTSPAAAADRTVQTLNRLAVRSMAASEQVGAAQQQQASEQSGEQMEEQLDDLAQQQSELMEQAQQMMPMQLGQQAMQQQMQQMAQGQQEVASELGEMSNQQGQEEQPLGDMSALAEEAAAIAQALAEGRLDRATMERQQRLFHRLLDAGRSLRKEEEDESEERESETAGEFEAVPVDALGTGDTGALRFRVPSAEYLSQLGPAERALVLRYFERLNRSAEPPPLPRRQ